MHDGAQSRTGTREAALPPSKWAAAQSIFEPPQNVLLSGTASVVWARGGTAVLSDKKKVLTDSVRALCGLGGALTKRTSAGVRRFPRPLRM